MPVTPIRRSQRAFLISLACWALPALFTAHCSNRPISHRLNSGDNTCPLVSAVDNTETISFLLFFFSSHASSASRCRNMASLVRWTRRLRTFDQSTPGVVDPIALKPDMTLDSFLPFALLCFSLPLSAMASSSSRSTASLFHHD